MSAGYFVRMREDMTVSDNKWFSEARFGMMLHWGLYSLLGGEYKGRQCGGADDGGSNELGEWIQSFFAIPCAEYEQYAKAFNPIGFDAEEYVKMARDAGMNYLVVTSKHHEGFAMFKSDVDPYNIVDATPFGRDPIAELAAACKKYGVKFGLYYSQELDWHEPDGGGYTRGYKNAGSSWTNNWDFPDNAHKDFSRCFEKKIKPQVKEILTKYGEISVIWFDTPSVISPAQSRELYDLVKKYQPNCLVNSRIGIRCRARRKTAVCSMRPPPRSTTPGAIRATIRTGKRPSRSYRCSPVWPRATSTICSTSAPIIWDVSLWARRTCCARWANG